MSFQQSNYTSTGGHWHSQSYLAGRDDGYYEAAKEAAEQDTPVFSAYPDPSLGWGVEVVCHWKGVYSVVRVSSLLYDRANYPEDMLLELSERLMYLCFQEWAKKKGYLR